MEADPIGQLSTVAAKKQRLAEIESFASVVRNKAILGTSSGEIGSWGIKMFSALAVKSGQACPLISVLPAIAAALGLPGEYPSYCALIGAIRGIGEADMADRIIAAAVPFLALEAAVDGVRGRHCDQISAIPDSASVTEVLSQAWRNGWPL